MKRSIAVVSFLLWTGIILGTYYVVQKPGLLSAWAGLTNTLWTLIATALLLFNSYCIGSQLLLWLGLGPADQVERVLLGCGIGLGALGLLGLVISAAQVARAPVFFFLLIGFTIFFILNGGWTRLGTDLRAFASHWNLSFSQYNFFTKLTLLLLLTIPFLLTLAPQFEAFDALLYHLTQPARILQDGGLRPVDIPHFWFPNLTENVYLWALALGSERAAQMMHLAWTILAALLLWHWAVKFWGVEAGRKTLLLFVAIPSLPMLASWAYADMTLAFYAIATLYALTVSESERSHAWLRTAAVTAGLAMTVKYTSFTVPLTGVLLLLFWGRKSFSRAIASALQFGAIALAVASPWYIRNAVIMGNPFYPFVFGGRYWDAFRAAWYASPGTGIGWDPLELFMLPLTTVLGYRDQNFFDGRIGPLLLLLAPLSLWVLFSGGRQASNRGLSLQAIGVFCAISFAAWTLGVINSRSLWQARLLLPALIPFVLLTALGWDALKALDSSRFKISFFANALIALVILLTLFDNTLFILQRNPLAVASGAQSRERYIERVNPSYAALMQVMHKLPPEARLYSLFEPRSYSLPRYVQPDPINDNFFHDLHRYQTPSAIIEQWKVEGYTHVLVSERGLSLARESNNRSLSAGLDVLQEALQSLEPVQQTQDKAYSIYFIP